MERNIRSQHRQRNANVEIIVSAETLDRRIAAKENSIDRRQALPFGFWLGRLRNAHPDSALAQDWLEDRSCGWIVTNGEGYRAAKKISRLNAEKSVRAPQKYTVTVTATSSVLQHATAISVTVQ